ncbi:MAG: hypothetical protein EAZ97_11470 [Bacteroidetes bacterium]|nr:MAG: hypothetical protein EAZ97_11470 [Bacteroidota bacterium]
MRIAIISEGSEDQAVIQNIFRAFGIDKSDIFLLKPSLQKDASSPDDSTIGTLQGVKNACIGYHGKRYYFERAIQFFDADFVVIHLDTAEIDRQDFDFQRPTRTNNENYCSELRSKVIYLINHWLENNYQNQIFYAIAIEEIEAWCLTIYEQNDSSKSANAKQKLNSILNKKDIKYDFDTISQDFRKIKKLQTFLEHNQSLKDFVESIQEKLAEL